MQGLAAMSHSGLKRAFVSEMNMRELLHASQQDDVDGTEHSLAWQRYRHND